MFVISFAIPDPPSFYRVHDRNIDVYCDEADKPSMTVNIIAFPCYFMEYEQIQRYKVIRHILFITNAIKRLSYGCRIVVK